MRVTNVLWTPETRKNRNKKQMTKKKNKKPTKTKKRRNIVTTI